MTHGGVAKNLHPAKTCARTSVMEPRSSAPTVPNMSRDSKSSACLLKPSNPNHTI